MLGSVVCVEKRCMILECAACRPPRERHARMPACASHQLLGGSGRTIDQLHFTVADGAAVWEVVWVAVVVLSSMPIRSVCQGLLLVFWCLGAAARNTCCNLTVGNADQIGPRHPWSLVQCANALRRSNLYGTQRTSGEHQVQYQPTRWQPASPAVIAHKQ